MSDAIDQALQKRYPALSMSMFATQQEYAKAVAEQNRAMLHELAMTYQSLAANERVLAQTAKALAALEGVADSRSDAVYFWPSLAALLVACICFGWRPWA